MNDYRILVVDDEEDLCEIPVSYTHLTLPTNVNV